jgi:hypothetical protein
VFPISRLGDEGAVGLELTFDPPGEARRVALQLRCLL